MKSVIKKEGTIKSRAITETKWAFGISFYFWKMSYIKTQYCFFFSASGFYSLYWNNVLVWVHYISVMLHFICAKSSILRFYFHHAFYLFFKLINFLTQWLALHVVPHSHAHPPAVCAPFPGLQKPAFHESILTFPFMEAQNKIFWS